MKGYMTTKEAAEKWHISQRQVQIHCKKGRIPGLITAGVNYMIPENTPRPIFGLICNSSEENTESKQEQ